MEWAKLKGKIFIEDNGLIWNILIIINTKWVIKSQFSLYLVTKTHDTILARCYNIRCYCQSQPVRRERDKNHRYSSAYAHHVSWQNIKKSLFWLYTL